MISRANSIYSLCSGLRSIEHALNRPFSSCLKPLFQSEAKYEAIDMEIIFFSHANKTRLHNEGFALSLVLKVRVFGTRKCSIIGVCMKSLSIAV